MTKKLSAEELAKIKFTNLNNHTYYSILKGYGSLKDHAKVHAEKGLYGLAVTDYSTMQGLLEFYHNINQENAGDSYKFDDFPKIMGTDAYLVENKKIKDIHHYPHRVTIFIKNQQGWKNLSKLTSNASSIHNISATQREKEVPRIDWSELLEHKDGLVIMSGAYEGQLPQSIAFEGYKLKEFIQDQLKDAKKQKAFLKNLNLKKISKDKFEDKTEFEFYKKIRDKKVLVEALNVICQAEHKNQLDSVINLTSFPLNDRLIDQLIDGTKVSLEEESESISLNEHHLSYLFNILMEHRPEEIIEEFQKEFGEDYYFELNFWDRSVYWDDKINDDEFYSFNPQKIINRALLDYSKKYKIPAILTQESLILKKKNHIEQSIMLWNADWNKKKGWRYYNEQFIHSVEEMYEQFQFRYPNVTNDEFIEICENSQLVVEKCRNVELKFKPSLPTIDYKNHYVNKVPVVIQRSLILDLQELKLWSEALKEKIQTEQSIKNIKSIPENIRSKYHTKELVIDFEEMKDREKENKRLEDILDKMQTFYKDEKGFSNLIKKSKKDLQLRTSLKVMMRNKKLLPKQIDRKKLIDHWFDEVIINYNMQRKYWALLFTDVKYKIIESSNLEFEELSLGDYLEEEFKHLPEFQKDFFHNYKNSGKDLTGSLKNLFLSNLEAIKDNIKAAVESIKAEKFHKSGDDLKEQVIYRISEILNNTLLLPEDRFENYLQQRIEKDPQYIQEVFNSFFKNFKELKFKDRLYKFYDVESPEFMDFLFDLENKGLIETESWENFWSYLGKYKNDQKFREFIDKNLQKHEIGVIANRNKLIEVQDDDMLLLGDKIFRDRLVEEINTIQYNGKLKLITYFMLIEDVCNFHKENNYIYGLGRGCLTGETLVLTEDQGYVELKNIERGTKVYTENGEAKQVLETFEYDIDEKIVKIQTSNSIKPITMTTDHKVFGLKKGSDFKECSAIEIFKEGDFLFVPKLERKNTIKEIDDFELVETTRKLKLSNDTDLMGYMDFISSLPESNILSFLNTFAEDQVISVNSFDLLMKFKHLHDLINKPFFYEKKDKNYLVFLDKENNCLFEEDGYYVKIKKLTIKKEKTKVYDLMIEDNPSYLTSNFLVHNSGAGSLFAHGLDITNCDPLYYGLYFERFLTRERIGAIYFRHPDYNLDLSKIKLGEDFSSANELGIDTSKLKEPHKTFAEEELWYLQCNPEDLKYLMALKKELKGKKIENVQRSTLYYLYGLSDDKPKAEIFQDPTTLPDIDYDTMVKDEVNKYLIYHFGDDYVTLMGTFGFLKTKGVIKDVMKQARQELSFDYVNKFTKLFEQIDEISYGKNFMGYFNDCLSEIEELSVWFKRNKDVHQYVVSLMGSLKNLGKHAGGVVVAGHKVPYIVPCRYDTATGILTTEPDMNHVESSGLIKYDFLGLKTLVDILKAWMLIEKRHGIRLNWDNINLFDPVIFERFRKGDAMTVFQFNKAWQRKYIQNLKEIRSIEDLATITSILRPGPMEMGMHDEYIHYVNGTKPIDYLHHSLEDILNETYGITCIKKGSKVLTNKGLVNIEDVKVGSYVKTEDGSFQKVLKNIYQGRKKTIKIKTTNGEILNCTKDHKILTQDGWKEAKDITTKDLIKSFWVNDNITLTIPEILIELEKSIKINDEFIFSSKEKVKELYLSLQAYGIQSGFDDNTLWVDKNNELINSFMKQDTIKCNKPNLTWAKVTSIKDDKVNDVYDLSIENVHSFVVSGLVVHNCYQEQVMATVAKLGDIVGNDSVTVLKAMGKKKLKALVKYKTKFIKKSQEKYPEDMAKIVNHYVTNFKEKYITFTLDKNFEPIGDANKRITDDVRLPVETVQKVVKNYKKGEETTIPHIESENLKHEVFYLNKYDLVEDAKKTFHFYIRQHGDGYQVYFNLVEVILCEKIWLFLEAFAKYGFNKSHAVAYSTISYVCMWLKHYYPIEWITACMSGAKGNNDDFKEFYQEWHDHIINPDINRSKNDYIIVKEPDPVKKKEVEMSVSPFYTINGVGPKAVEYIVNTQPYISLSDFYRRVERSKVNKKAILHLILCGAMDNLKPDLTITIKKQVSNAFTDKYVEERGLKKSAIKENEYNKFKEIILENEIAKPFHEKIKSIEDFSDLEIVTKHDLIIMNLRLTKKNENLKDIAKMVSSHLKGLSISLTKENVKLELLNIYQFRCQSVLNFFRLRYKDSKPSKTAFEKDQEIIQWALESKSPSYLLKEISILNLTYFDYYQFFSKTMERIGAISPGEVLEKANRSIKNFDENDSYKKPKGYSFWVGGAIKRAQLEKVIDEEKETFGMEFARVVLGNKGKNLRIKIPIGVLSKNDDTAKGIMKIRDWVYTVEENPIPVAMKVNVNYWKTKEGNWRPYYTLDNRELQNIKILLDLSKSNLGDEDE